LKSYPASLLELGRFGLFNSDNPLHSDGDLNEIKLCKEWMSVYAIKRATVNKNFSSYGLKHVIERAADTYIGNGACIQAALEMGYKIFPVSVFHSNPNCYFDMKISKNAPGLLR
jgi:hypothetical protein